MPSDSIMTLRTRVEPATTRMTQRDYVERAGPVYAPRLGVYGEAVYARFGYENVR